MSFSFRHSIIIGLILLLSTPVLAQEFDSEDALVKTDTMDSKWARLVGLPILFYTPETKVAFGAGGMLYLTRNTNIYNKRASNIFFNAIYTTEKQLVIDVKPQVFFRKGDYYLDAAYKFQILPYPFWGIGNSTDDSRVEQYNMTSNEIKVAFLKRLRSSLNFGFEYIFEDHNVTEFDSLKVDGTPGEIGSGLVPGGNGAIISGLGVIFNFDNRDNIQSPTSGYFGQINARFSSKNMGATNNFSKYIIDFRNYKSLGEKSTFAFQAYLENTFGDVPFQDLAWFGGGERGRGYFKGRYMDKHMYVLQMEYRYQLLKRVKLAGFAMVGEVADFPDNFFSTLKPSFGGGVRYQIFKNDATLLRFDIGVGEDGSPRMYFGVNEAF